MSTARERLEARAAPVRAWVRAHPWVDYALPALAAVVMFAFIRFSGEFEGNANGFLLLAAIVTVVAVAAMWFVPERDTREWITLFLTVAVVYAILAAFSLRGGNLGEQYLVETGFVVGMFAIFALGLSLQMGYGGLLNFGHVGFMLLGGYTVAVWTTRWGRDIAPAFEGAGLWALVMTAVAAILLGVTVYALVLVLAQRIRVPPVGRILVAAIPAALLAGAFALAVFPLDSRGAMFMVVLLGVLMAVALAALAGLFLGFASLRLREDYLAIVTLGAAEILRLAATNERWLTNGSLGILLSAGRQELPIGGWVRENDWFRDWSRSIDIRDSTLLATAIVTVIVLVAVFVFLESLARSPWGRVLRSIREDEEVPAALGKNVLLYKLQVLMLGSALAAIAGILFLWKKTNIYPTDFLPIMTFYAVAILVLGGIGNHKGAILGAVIIWGIFEFSGGMNNAFRADCNADPGWFVSIFCDFAGPKQQLLIGLVMMLVILFRPQGAVGNREELLHAK